LTALERRLQSWRPAADALDTDAMLFAAGRASARPRRTFVWPAVAASLALVAAGLGVWLAAERGARPAPVPRLAEKSSPDASPAPGPQPVSPDPSSYLALTERFRDFGSDALVASRPAGGATVVQAGPVLRAGSRELFAEP